MRKREMIYRPRVNRDPNEIDRKLTLLREPHLAPLTEFVWQLRQKHDGVPLFDPDSGGVFARALFVFEAPGAKTQVEHAGAFISIDNNDQSAENMTTLLQECQVDRSKILFWNIVPWYLGNSVKSKIRAPRISDLEESAPAMTELVSLLPKLRVVVLCGRQAQRGWPRLGLRNPTLAMPHSSPLSLNGWPERKDEIRSVLHEVAEWIR